MPVRHPKVHRHVVVAALAALMCLGQGAMAQPAPSAALDALAARAAIEGSVRVIVGLNLPSQPEGRLRAGAVLQQRADIRATQNVVVNRLLVGTAGRVHARFDTIPFLAAEVDAGALARLRSSALVKYVQEDRLARPSLLQSNPLINAPTAWSHGHTGAGWAVAVLDTGVDRNHPFLAGKVVSEACYSTDYSNPQYPQYTSQTICPGGDTASTAFGSAMPCADLCTHGTHVAGIAAGGTASNGANGVAKDAGVIAVQVFSYFPAAGSVMAWTSDLIRGLERVLALSSSHNIAAVNMSLGGDQYEATCDDSDPATKTAIDNLRSVGIATVVAAGNSGWRTSISSPACISSAISVAASCDSADGGYCAAGVDGIAGYSNMAGFVSLVAPGSVITSSVPGGGYANKQGTSMATPHVAGAWALLKQAQPAIGVTEALALFRSRGLTVNDTRSGGSVTGLTRIDLAFIEAPGYMLNVGKAGAGAGTVTSADGQIACGSNCAHRYAVDTAVTLTAAVAPGAGFSGWSGDCSGIALTCSVSMTAARSVTATFAADYALVVAKAGSGSAAGTVSSSPAGINCGSDCSESYAVGTSVTLTAAATAAGRFTGWSGACTGTQSTCTIGMTAARSVTANFVARYGLGVSKIGNAVTAGTVTSAPAGIDCGSDCFERYDSDTPVTLTAVASGNARFTGWSGACTGKTDSCSVSMTAARSVKAAFNTLEQLAVAIDRVVSTASGTVTSAPAGISCGSICSADFNTGSSVTLTAKPAGGSFFVGWGGACSGNASTCTVGMTAPQEVAATFDKLYTLTVTKTGTAAASGSVTSVPAGVDCGSDCSQSYANGTSVTLTAVAGAGAKFTGWSAACTGKADTCTVSMSAARSVKAAFNTQELLTVAIGKVTSTASGTVTSWPAGMSCGGSCSAEFNTGSSVTLTAKPASNSVFLGWSGACAGTAITCTLSMTSAQAVTATFNKGFTLTVTRSGAAPASGTVTSMPAGIDCGSDCSERYEIGTPVTLTAVAGAGATFTGWSGACSGGASTCIVDMTAGRTATASFDE